MSESAQPRRPEHRVRVASNGPAVARKVETVRLETAIKAVRDAMGRMALHANITEALFDHIERQAMADLKKDAKR